MTYEIPDSAPRKKCQECDAELAFVVNPKTGKTVPVRVSTGESHFLDCPNPKRFSKKLPPKPKTAQPEPRPFI